MKFSTRQLLINLLSILIALSAIMMLSYVQASVINRAPNAFPFNMGLNYVIMKREPGQRVSFDDIVDVDEDTGVLIISRDENSETIGVYDPNMTKAFENTIPGRLMGMTRYFSYDDYVNKTKAGILVTYAPRQEYTSDNISELLYCTDLRSSFNYDRQVKEVVNLASLDTLGEYVYLDYGDEEVANRIIKRLRDSGYRRQTPEYVGLLKSLFSAKGFYDGIMTGGLLIYVFFGLAAFWHFYNDRKTISIHFLHGGTLKKMAGNLGVKFILLNLLGMIPVLLFSFFQQRTIFFFMMTDFSLMTFLAVHVLLTSLMYFLAFYFVFVMVRTSRRGDYYVR